MWLYNPTLAEGTSIYVSDDPNAVINVSNDKLKESIKRETLYFPPLKFDGIPNSDINSVPNTITTTTDPVIIVIDNNLTLNKLDVIGDGKIRIFVKGDLIIDANQPIGNKPNQIEIYCYGDSLSVEGNTEIYTDIYVYKAESVVFGQSKFYGLIYAPNSKFTSKANHEYYGIIAKEVTLKNAELNNPMAELKIPFDEGYLESSKNTVHYIEGHYK